MIESCGIKREVTITVGKEIRASNSRGERFLMKRYGTHGTVDGSVKLPVSDTFS
jgi:hypothetical protein